MPVPLPASPREPALTWSEANQRYLSAALAVVHEHVTAIGRVTELRPQSGATAREAAALLEQAEQALPAPAALQLLCSRFALSPFERDILLLCAGCELDTHFAASCAAAHDDAQAMYASFRLALQALPFAHWSAVTPDAPLRRWRLLEPEGQGLLIGRPLRIDERVLHYLAGVSYLDEWLRPIAVPLLSSSPLPPSQDALSAQVVTAAARSDGASPLLIQLYGDDEQAQLDVAAAAAQALGLTVYQIKDLDLPSAPGERDELVLRWQREARLHDCALLISCHTAERLPSTLALLGRLGGLVILASAEPLAMPRPPVLRLEVKRPDVKEQQALWRRALSALGPTAETDVQGALDTVAAHFRLSAAEIQSAGTATCTALLSQRERGVGAAFSEALWDSCRTQARTRLDNLAQRIDPVAGWADLVLPEPQLDLLRQLAGQVHKRAQVYEQWGFASKGQRGLGISALFAGNSGTGKTLAAEVVAHELRLDLYHIDLSQIVSKYIGETEKNLRRIFDAAEAGGAVLLFDEADSLFGKRSEIKDSHDRYANIEVSYLLQRMEAYRGLAILTTNMKAALDAAFLRRLRFIVSFPFPDSEQRQQIWRRVFPANTPTEGLNHQKLARLSVAGGHIRNIALHAAFLAAAAGEPVRMHHLLRAARCEYAKLEKPLTDAEIGGWM